MKRSWVHVLLKPEFLRLPCDFHKTAMIFDVCVPVVAILFTKPEIAKQSLDYGTENGKAARYFCEIQGNNLKNVGLTFSR